MKWIEYRNASKNISPERVGRPSRIKQLNPLISPFWTDTNAPTNIAPEIVDSLPSFFPLEVDHYAPTNITLKRVERPPSIPPFTSPIMIFIEDLNKQTNVAT